MPLGGVAVTLLVAGPSMQSALLGFVCVGVLSQVVAIVLLVSTSASRAALEAQLAHAPDCALETTEAGAVWFVPAGVLLERQGWLGEPVFYLRAGYPGVRGARVSGQALRLDLEILRGGGAQGSPPRPVAETRTLRLADPTRASAARAAVARWARRRGGSDAPGSTVGVAAIALKAAGLVLLYGAVVVGAGLLLAGR